MLSPYLGVICGLLLAGATIDALGSRRRTPITLSAVGSLGAILLLLGLMGWFAPGYDRLSDGYPGYVSQNLLGGILPIGCERCAPGYSIPAPEGQDPTTYSFAGAGGVVLTLIGIGLTARATLGWLRARRRPRYLGLAAALLVGSVYALGPELTLGPWVLGEIPTPLAEINRALTTLFRNRWFFAWPMLLFLMAVGAAWLVRRRHGAIVLSILAVAQILWAQPLLANAGTYRDPLQTPWDGLFARVAELSPGGMVFAEPMRCSRELLGDPYGELFVITHAATAATGRAGLPILGVRTVRVPDEIGCNRPESELRERHATGMTLILGGGLGDRSPARALPGITCWALPLIAVCPGRSPEALGETDFVRRFGLPVDTSSGAPIIPGRLSGDRIAAAVSLSGTGWRLADGIWREDIRAVGQVHGMRPRIPSGVRATLRISWDRNDGDTIRLRTVDEDGLLLPDHVIEGVCDTTRCRIDELLPLTTTRAYLIEIRVEARD